jgi:hypothetical protein
MVAARAAVARQKAKEKGVVMRMGGWTFTPRIACAKLKGGEWMAHLSRVNPLFGW